MPVITTRRARVTVETVVVAKQCNVCGVTEPYSPDGNDMHEIILSGGYGDKYPSDMETISFVVHGACLKTWTDTFKVPVDSQHYGWNEVTPYPVVLSGSGARMVHDPVSGWIYPADAPVPVPCLEDMAEWSDDLPPIIFGVYMHFKRGDLYEVTDWGVIPHSNGEPNELCVVYRALYEGHDDGVGVYVRPYTSFFDDAEGRAPLGRFVRLGTAVSPGGYR